MKDILIIKNSNTLLNNDIYFPDKDNIDYGELILNNSADKEALFIKNDKDEIIPFRSKAYTLDKINSNIPKVTISETAPPFEEAKEGDIWIEPIPPIPLTLEFTTTAPNEVITLPCQGSVNITVDWGDGSKETITTDNPTHSYNNIGVYIVKITGDFVAMRGCSPDVTKVINWGNTNTLLNSMDGAFGWCSKLTSIPGDDYEQFANVTNFGQTFRNCSGLISSIPENLFSSCYNVTIFHAVFSGCTNLIGSIPENLFANCHKVTDFSETFFNCQKLSGNIPENLFKNNPNVTGFSSTFNRCYGLTGSIPETLFASCRSVPYFSWTFSGCTGLTGSIPEGLFANSPNVIQFYATFAKCSGLTSIPEGLFTNCPNVRSFYWTFYDCSGLTSIPSGLFANCPNVTTFNSTFSGCSDLTGTTPTDTDGGQLWERTHKPGYPYVTGTQCFRYCYELSNYTSIPSSWK